MFKKLRYSLLFFIALFSISCITVKREAFESFKPPAAPDFWNTKMWICLPEKKDAADILPGNSGLKDEQDIAKADVFFIHTTTCVTLNKWNASLKNSILNKRTDGLIKYQVSAFNGSCKVYAPRYRQAVLYSFFDSTGSGKKAISLAYEDVKAAFEYYLKNYNKGRPIIIAGHSQGAKHGIRLLKEFFDGMELQKQLVTAYFPGMPVLPGAYSSIEPCNSPEETNCFNVWNTAEWGSATTGLAAYFKGSICTNPLNWKTDTSYVSATNNLGGVDEFFNAVDKNICDAKCHEGLLWVHEPRAHGYQNFLWSYHLMDINLFYMNLRANVKQRIDAFLKKN